MCRNWTAGPNLQCLTPPGGSIKQCLCLPSHTISITVLIYVIQRKPGNNHVVSVHVMQQEIRVIKVDHFHVLIIHVIVRVFNGGMGQLVFRKVNKEEKR